VDDALVTVQRTIDAPRQLLFDLVADPEQHPLIDGSSTVRAARAGHPVRLALGSTFGMDMKLGLGYRVTNTVVEFEEGRLIAWRHFYGHRWRYRFEASIGGTLVTEQWDARPSKGQRLLVALGYPDRHRLGMARSLERLAELAEHAQH
jgi:uncharacterized protein YndB with AHSA1/START domain